MRGAVFSSLAVSPTGFTIMSHATALDQTAGPTEPVVVSSVALSHSLFPFPGGEEEQEGP